MSYGAYPNPLGYAVQNGSRGTQDLMVKTIVGYASAQGSLGNKASIPMTVPPVDPVDDAQRAFDPRNPVHGLLEHSSNTFCINPNGPVDKNGYPEQHAGGSYGIVAWISLYPGGDNDYLGGPPEDRYFTRKINTTYYNEFILIQDELWANDAYTNMPSAYMMNGKKVNGGSIGYFIMGNTAYPDKSEARFLNLVLVRNDSTTFQDYDPSNPFIIGSILNSPPGTNEFQTYIPPESEAYWTSTRWLIRTTYPRSKDGTVS